MSSIRRHRLKILSNPIQLWVAAQTRKPPERLNCLGFSGTTWSSLNLNHQARRNADEN